MRGATGVAFAGRVGRGAEPTADPALANPYVNGLPDEKQQQLARRYADIFRTIVEQPGWVSRVTFWGLSDADSWLNRGRANHPLLWDRQRQPKPALQAVMDVLLRASAGRGATHQGVPER